MKTTYTTTRRTTVTRAAASKPVAAPKPRTQTQTRAKVHAPDVAAATTPDASRDFDLPGISITGHIGGLARLEVNAPWEFAVHVAEQYRAWMAGYKAQRA